MDLRGYFEEKRGFGVLATADREGKVGIAVYSRPHVLEDGTVAFIMPHRQTHHNLQSNPHAAYLFWEEPKEGGKRYEGVRLYLTKVGEETDPQRIASLRRKTYEGEAKELFLVTFRVEKVLPLIGIREEDLV